MTTWHPGPLPPDVSGPGAVVLTDPDTRRLAVVFRGDHAVSVPAGLKIWPREIAWYEVLGASPMPDPNEAAAPGAPSPPAPKPPGPSRPQPSPQTPKPAEPKPSEPEE